MWGVLLTHHQTSKWVMQGRGLGKEVLKLPKHCMYEYSYGLMVDFQPMLDTTLELCTHSGEPCYSTLIGF